MKLNLKSLLMAAVVAMPMAFTSCEEKVGDDPTKPGIKLIGEITVNENGTATAKLDVTCPVEGALKSVEALCVYDGNGQEMEEPVQTNKVEIGKTNNQNWTVVVTFPTKVDDKYNFDVKALKVIATTKDGGEATEVFNMPAKEPEEPEVKDELEAAKKFEWKRVGSNPATGLEEFGLAWTLNSNMFAIVKKDKAAKFVELDAKAWTEITTKTALAEAIETAAAIEEYKGVSSTEAVKVYDVVLAVKNGDVCYMIHITQSKVLPSPKGTEIIITGQSKK